MRSIHVKVFISLLLLVMLANQVMSSDSGTVMKEDGPGETTFSCPDIYPNRLHSPHASVSSDGTVTCTYECRDFRGILRYSEEGVTDIPSANNNPIIKTAQPGETISISQVEIRNRCCTPDSDVCYHPDENTCYYHYNPSQCSGDVSTGAVSSSCTIFVYTIAETDGGDVISYTETSFEDDVETCLNLREQCPGDAPNAYMDPQDNVHCCPPEAEFDGSACIIPEPTEDVPDLSCVCSDPESFDSPVYCTISDDTGTLLDNEPFEHDGSGSFVYTHDDDRNAICRYNIEEREGELSCSCTVASSEHFSCTIYEEIHWDSDVNRRSIDRQTVPFPDHHGSTVYRTLEVDGREVECPMDVPYGCDITDDQRGDGVCYEGCRSWEDPDCDYGRSGRKAVEFAAGVAEDVVETVLGWFNIDADVRLSPNHWWQRALEDTFLSDVHSWVQDDMWGTPEWFTNLVCSANIDVDDETACELMGLDQDCIGQEEWGGAGLFAEGPAVTLAARKISDDSPNEYILRWAVQNIRRSEMQVFLIDIDSSVPADYSQLKTERTMIYPEEGDFGELNSALYEYKTSNEYSHACILFDADDEEIEEALLEELATVGMPFVCRSIAD